MKINKLTILVLLILIAPGAEAQFINKLKKAAQEGVENAVERRVSQEIENAAARQTDRYMNQVFGPPSEYEGTGYDYGKMMGMNMNVKTEDSYSFSGFTDMLITGTDNKGKEIDPTNFRSFLSPEGEFWALEMENDDEDIEKAIMIFDNKNKATVMLMTDKKGEKSRIAYSLDWSGMMEESMDESMTADSTFNLTKTGNSKEILGYTCDEYLSENDQYAATLWVSRDPIEGYASYWSRNNYLFTRHMKEKYKSRLGDLPDGNVLEINYRSKEDKSITNMTITDINTTDESTFSLDEYINIMEGREGEN